MRIRIIAAAMSALALTACGQPQEQAKSKQDEAYPVSMAPDVNTRIGPDGAAGIANALPMDLVSVRQAAAHFIARGERDCGEGLAFSRHPTGVTFIRS